MHRWYRISLVILFVFMLTGCTIDALKEKIGWLDEKIGEAYKDFQDDQSEKILNFAEDGKKKKETWQTLTKEQKDKIDNWLKENGFNEYGDLTNTAYEKGSPLLIEGAQELKSRFEYIWENHPDIFEKIK